MKFLETVHAKEAQNSFNSKSVRSLIYRVITLRKSIKLLAVLGLVSSVSLAMGGFFLAPRYDNAVEFGPMERLGLNPFRLMAYRYTLLAILFLIYLLSDQFKHKLRFRLFLEFPILISIAAVAGLIISDSGDLLHLLPAYKILSLILDNGGTCFLLGSIVLFILNGGLLWLRRHDKNFP